MSLFCGKTCRCKKRCKAAFPNARSLRKGCQAACKSDSSLDVTTYLCDPRWGVQEEIVIREYGYDPCKGGATIEEVFDPLNDRDLENGNNDALSEYIPYAVALLVVALIILLIVVL